MKLLLAGTALAGLFATVARADLDRTYQPSELVFEPGNYAAVTAIATAADVAATGLGAGPLPGGTAYDGIVKEFTSTTLGVKVALSPGLDAALILDHPFGADLAYPGDPATTEFGGTSALAETRTLTALARLRLDGGWSVFGGPKLQTASGEIALGGLAYGGPPPGGVSSYRVDLAEDMAPGWVAGVAYERPEIALRVALTYQSEVHHRFAVTERLAGGVIAAGHVESRTPRTIRLDAQTGVAPGTLAFGTLRWAEWSAFRVDPDAFLSLAGEGLVDLDDTFSATFGLARAISDRLSASAAFTWQPGQDDTLVSPLAPTNGQRALTLGARYQLTERTDLGGFLRLTSFGDAEPETGTPDTARAATRDAGAATLGLQLGYRF